MTPTLEAALLAASRNPTADNLAAILTHLPDRMMNSEIGRRRAALRKTCAGPTGHWSKHNPEVDNCRCLRCHKRRLKKSS